MSSSSVPIRNSKAPLAPVALLVGSLAAPLIYVMAGLIIPEGFHNLRSADVSTVLVAFGSAWIFSALFTCVVGGASWVPLHKLGHDSLISYVLVALVSEVSFSLVAGAAPEIFGISMAAANAVAVRAAEVAFCYQHETA